MQLGSTFCPSTMSIRVIFMFPSTIAADAYNSESSKSVSAQLSVKNANFAGSQNIHVEALSSPNPISNGPRLFPRYEQKPGTQPEVQVALIFTSRNTSFLKPKLNNQTIIRELPLQLLATRSCQPFSTKELLPC